MEKTVAERAAQLFIEAAPVEPIPSDVGAVPVAHNGCDTCAAYEGDDDLQQRAKGRRT